ncbi:MAG: hypothetical protein MAG715_01030 [Methanonatronarchaeales archaeon]|nr:hypothetical protein [Methanonatronarchaeales archaeon]
MNGGARMTTGVVKFFHDQKGYGFIEVKGEDEDIFFHISDADAITMDEGAEVEFEITEGDRGPRAVDVKTL